jgi:hypothetical protein
VTDRAFGKRKHLRLSRKPMAMAATHPSEAAADIAARHLVATPYQAARSIAAWDTFADERAVYDQLVTITGEAAAGSLRRSEELLMAQAVTLDLLFNSLARRARSNLDQAPEYAETVLRLALRAQSQSRATLESLGALLQPSTTAFIRQGDHATAQVLIGRPPVTGARSESPPTEQSGDQRHELLPDARASTAAGRANPALAPVGALDRSAHASREDDRVEERRPGRHETAAAGDR